jgi:hypothetical protein
MWDLDDPDENGSRLLSHDDPEVDDVNMLPPDQTRARVKGHLDPHDPCRKVRRPEIS